MMPKMTLDTLIQLSTYCGHERCNFSLISRSLSFQSGSRCPEAISPCLAFPATSQYWRHQKYCAAVLQESQSHSALCTYQHVPWDPPRPHHLPVACICLIGHGRLPPKPTNCICCNSSPSPLLSIEAFATPHMQVQLQHNECLSGNVGSEPFG